MLTLVTHSGPFHADEVFAVALFKIYWPEPFKIVRSREPKVIKAADIVVDVGREYDPARRRFDHHQTLPSALSLRPNGIPYSSCGLVWQYLGVEFKIDPPIYERFDRVVAQPIDASDSGFDLFQSRVPGVKPYSVGKVIDSFMPLDDNDPALFDQGFFKALELAESLVQAELQLAELITRDEQELKSLYQAAGDRRFVVAERYLKIDRVTEKLPELLYLVEPSAQVGHWQVVAIRQNPDLYALRRPLPESWTNKTEAEFQQLTGVPDAIFCHKNRFLAIAASREGALALAQRALMDP